MNKLLVEVYCRKDCCLCSEAIAVIDKVKQDIPFQFREVDITTCENLYRRYREDVPTIFINGKKAFKFKVDEREFRKRIKREYIKAELLRLSNKGRDYRA